MGLIGYYRRFVEGFFSIAKPLTHLLHKNIKSEWTESCQNSFDKLKRKLTTILVLVLLDGTDDFEVYSDTS